MPGEPVPGLVDDKLPLAAAEYQIATLPGVCLQEESAPFDVAARPHISQAELSNVGCRQTRLAGLEDHEVEPPLAAIVAKKVAVVVPPFEPVTVVPLVIWKDHSAWRLDTCDRGLRGAR